MPAISEEGKIPLRVETYRGGQVIQDTNDALQRAIEFIRKYPGCKKPIRVAAVFEITSAPSEADNAINAPEIGYKVTTMFPPLTGHTERGLLAGDEILINKVSPVLKQGNLLTLIPEDLAQGGE